MTQQTVARMEAEDAAPSATGGKTVRPGDDRRLGARRRVAKFVLVLGVAASLAAGGWGVASSANVQAHPARIGEAVEVSGGFVRVDAVTPEHMVPMQSSKFAASGMSMSSMGMDMAPEGQRRLTVDVALAAEGGALSYSPEEFHIAGEGVKETGPIRDTFEGGTVPAGDAVSGSLVFQVPEDAKGLELSFDEGRPVALDLPPAEEGEGHEHGAPAERGGHEEDGHDH